MRTFWLLPCCGLVALAACSPLTSTAPRHTVRSQPALESAWPGPRPDGSVLLPNQWSLHPVGRQLDLADFPVNIALHPEGRFAAILHAGYGKHQILVVDLQSCQIVCRTNIAETFYGLEFAPDGKALFCSGAGDEVLHRFAFDKGVLSNHQQIVLHKDGTGIPAGLALDKAGRTLYACNLRADSISRVILGPSLETGEIVLRTHTPGTKAVPAQPSADFDTAAADKREQALLYDNKADETFPYACRLDEQRRRLYVSLWAQAAVAVIDLSAQRVVSRWETGEHPCEMALTRSGGHLFVANANHNTVTVFDTGTGKAIETIWAALYPDSPPGSTPNSLALSPDEKTLFVANACNNAVAVFDVSRPGKSRSLGFIPVGWYPTSVRVSLDGRCLLVANGKGGTSKANPHGPQPGVSRPASQTVEYIGGLFQGTLSVIDLPQGKALATQMSAWTAEAYRCSPIPRDAKAVAFRPANSPIPAAPGGSSPLKYCLYIIKENRTYDQVLGDMPEGNGDRNLCLFPEPVTPNHHQLARDFVLLDNFYVESEVSADGHEWTMGAYATDFVEKSWPLNYGHNRSGKFSYPSEGNFAVAVPAGGYLWDRAKEAGVSYRSYGEFVTNPGGPTKPARAKSRNLQGHFDEWYHGFDMAYSDAKRADRFIAELDRFEQEGDMPRLQILRLPNDHTHGTTKGFRTPTAYLADNDLALGRVVEALSRSRFWPQTAIFVVEDDAQNGPDHVDAHRTVAFVISPYTRRGAVDSTLYSTSSMLRTMELILGLKPMSQFDAAARPMFNSFQAAADLRPYTARPAGVDVDAQNTEQAWGGNIPMNFAVEDAADDLLLNEVVWRSVRGPEHPMPAPVRAAFVLARPETDDD